MGNFVYVVLVCGIAAIIIGILEIRNKRLYLRIERRYEKESIKKFAPLDGAICIVVGIGAIVIFLTEKNILPEKAQFFGYVMVFLGIFEDVLQGRKKLKQIVFDHEEIF